jgi:putative endonuclease
MAKPSHCAVGKAGEDAACAALARAGYEVLARRWRTRAGEIDIVAADGSCVAFIEVKTRASDRCGAPLEAVTRAKRRRLTAMASDFLRRHRVRAACCRFDVVAVTLRQGAPRVEIVKDAFAVGE